MIDEKRSIDVKMSGAIGEIASALAKAQSEFPSIKKSQKVDFTHEGKRTNYSYADLSKFVEVIRPILSKNEIAVLNPTITDERGVGVSTLLAHSSGQWLHSGLLFMRPGNNKPQSAGSAGTFARRYSLVSFLSLISEDDDDDALAAQHALEPVFTGTKQQMEVLMSLFNQYPLHKDDRRKLTDWLIEQKHPADAETLQITVAKASEKIAAKKGSNDEADK